MTPPESPAVEPFDVTVPDAAIDDLNARLANARWPDQLPGTGWSYGTDQDYLQAVCEYWRTAFDWDGFEDRFNAFDQYTATVNDHHLHFYHAKSPEPAAEPLLLSHGWPGSVAEFLDVIGPLTDPAAHGGDPEDAFHVVAPSLPGYGFSGPTETTGVDVQEIAETFAVLMAELDYDTYFAHGGDWGALITAILGAEYPDHVDAIHLTMLFVKPSSLTDPMDLLDEAGMADYRATKAFQENETGYMAVQETKPQSMAYGLHDSPVGLAGWIIEKFHGWSDCEDDVESAIDRTRLLDNLSVYWLTETINSSMRLYYETDEREVIPDSVAVPTGHARYPAEILKTPRAWAERVYNITQWTEQPAGGHFAAMEVPELFVEDVRSYFRTIQ